MIEAIKKMLGLRSLLLESEQAQNQDDVGTAGDSKIPFSKRVQKRRNRNKAARKARKKNRS